MNFLKKAIYSLALAALTVPAAKAGPVMVSAKLDSVNLLMGNVTTLRLEVVHDENVSGVFPLLKIAEERGRATLVGDTVEIGKPLKVDTTRIGSGRLQINYEVPVQAFDSGTYVLPPVWFIAGRDSAASKPLNLRIIPVKALATDSISPLAGVVNGKGSSILDSVPDWLYYYWWVICLVAVACVGTWWYLSRRKKNKPLVPKPIKVQDPAEEAIQALKRLKERKLWEQGREKEYFTDLTEIIRRYLVRRFGINAMEMTSREIIQALTSTEANRSREYVRKVLDMADFVKFAKVRPLPADNITAYNNAYDFITETAKAEESQSDDSKNGKAESTGEAKHIHNSGKEGER